MSPSTALLVISAGVISHVFYFNHGEHHMHGMLYLQLVFLAATIGIAVLTTAYSYTIEDARNVIMLFLGNWLAGVYVSLIFYRLFMNPLNQFGGPYLSRLTGFWQAFHYAELDGYYKLVDLHEQYGDFVRIGPTDLSITHPEAVDLTFCNNSVTTKSSWYDGEAPWTSMQTCRDKSQHDKRRRIWSSAFSEKSIRTYEPALDELSTKLLSRFSNFKGSPINVAKWFNLYSFDAMGRLAFSKDYGMLDTGEKHHAIQFLTDAMAPLAFRLPVWFLRVMLRLPGLDRGIQQFIKFSNDELTWRVRSIHEKGASERSDIMTSILKAYEHDSAPEKDKFLQADARLIIVAGSDTTASTFTYLFYHLAQRPEVVKKLRYELDPLTEGDWHDADIRNAHYLNACITEALRLHPAIPSGVPRQAPADGIRIGTTFIPPYTNFWLPAYAIHRDERNFADAQRFIPERWTDRPDLVRNRDAWHPFIRGPFSCIGKNLAFMELRTLTTRLIQKFDFKFAPGEDGSCLLTKTLDHFTVHVGDLFLELSER